MKIKLAVQILQSTINCIEEEIDSTEHTELTLERAIRRETKKQQEMLDVLKDHFEKTGAYNE
jgi:hypothetical protein